LALLFAIPEPPDSGTFDKKRISILDKLLSLP